MTEADGAGTTSPAPPEAASAVFGAALPTACEFADLLAVHGVERGLIGPREVDRLWDRHLLNSAVIGELIPRHARVVDLGSGAGLPGIALALVRPDLNLILVEPMARRVAWLDEVVRKLGLGVLVVRGRAEEPAVKERVGGADVVTARALAPLGRLSEWSLPLLRAGGVLIAIKGAHATAEVERDSASVASAGGGTPRISTCGDGLLTIPTTVVVIERLKPARRDRGRRTRKDR
jgi:16S rRNA (guanine527-N7)-methyltransferase